MLSLTNIAQTKYNNRNIYLNEQSLKNDKTYGLGVAILAVAEMMEKNGKKMAEINLMTGKPRNQKKTVKLTKERWSSLEDGLEKAFSGGRKLKVNLKNDKGKPLKSTDETSWKEPIDSKWVATLKRKNRLTSKRFF